MALPTKQKFEFNKAPPKEFKKSVDIILVDGALAEIEFNFIYRTRKEFAALVDENIAEAGARNAAANSKPKKKASADQETVVDLYAQIDKFAAEYVLKIASGWDLDDEFNLASLLKLEDENPGSLSAISTVYRDSVSEARTKNS